MTTKYKSLILLSSLIFGGNSPLFPLTQTVYVDSVQQSEVNTDSKENQEESDSNTDSKENQEESDSNTDSKENQEESDSNTDPKGTNTEITEVTEEPLKETGGDITPPAMTDAQENTSVISYDKKESIGDGYEKEVLRWGTSPWAFDEDSGVLTIEAGALGMEGSQPWSREDEHKIDIDAIKKIKFTGGVVAPFNSTRLFRGLKNVEELEGFDKVDTSKVADMTMMFSEMSSLTSIDVSNFDTSKVTDMAYMFSEMSSLTSIDVSNFDTSKVTNMAMMFNNMSSLTSIDVSNFDTSSVVDMAYMFSEMSSLTSIDVSSFDTSKVTNMAMMFNKMSSLTSIDVSNFDTSKVTNMTMMFNNMSSLTSIDVSNFDTSRIVNMYAMFYNMSSLTSIDVSNFDTSKVTNMSYMFSAMSSLTSIDVSNFDTSKVTNMSYMFNNVSSLTSIDVSSFDTSKVTNMKMMFNNMPSLTSIDVSSFDTSKVTDMTMMFNNMSSLGELTLGEKFTFGQSASLPAPNPSTTGEWTRTDGKSDSYAPKDFMKQYGSGDLTAGTYVGDGYEKEALRWGTSPWAFDEDSGVLKIKAGALGIDGSQPWSRKDEHKIDIDAIKKIKFTGGVVAPSNSSRLFRGLKNVEEFEGFDKVDTSSVVNMAYMFGDLSSLTSIDVSNFDTSKVTDMAYMFSEMSSLTSIDVSNFDTSKVTNMAMMFNNMSSLTSIDVSNFDTSKVTNMTMMFNKMSSLTSIDVSNFDTSSVVNMYAVFYNMSSLTSIDVSNFDTSKVTNMSYMFSAMSSLTSIDVSSFDTSKVTDMSYMFNNVSSLTSIDVSSFDTSKVTNMKMMFNNMPSLGELTLGEKFTFGQSASLPAPNPSTKGEWTRKDGTSASYAPTDFMKQYGSGDLTAGTYVGDGYEDGGWINVTLPTELAYYSTGDSGHKDIESKPQTYEVVNNSLKPISLKVNDFRAKDGGSGTDTTNIKDLNLNNVPLIKDGTVALFDESSKLLDLGTEADEKSGYLEFSGKTDEGSNLDEAKEVLNELRLTITLGDDFDSKHP